jgi:hypothetical protein
MHGTILELDSRFLGTHELAEGVVEGALRKFRIESPQRGA